MCVCVYIYIYIYEFPSIAFLTGSIKKNSSEIPFSYSSEITEKLNLIYNAFQQHS